MYVAKINPHIDKQTYFVGGKTKTKKTPKWGTGTSYTMDEPQKHDDR